ncbi:MAG: NADH-quinone oxidoreductase subunit D [Propionibacterium sp.]|nr:NADH-quinone oxidoreductase subunit D [Propionibacterium sp.]
MTRDTLAIGSLGQLLDRHWISLDLGPEHPTRAGLLLIDVDHTDGIIRSVRVQPGHSHRAAEKLFEVRDIRQVLSLADRHDWTAAVHGELLTARAAEHLLGLPVPSRADWARSMLAEHARIASHLAHLSFVPFRLGRHDLSARIRLAREDARDLLVELTGNRVHPMVIRLGGFAADPTPAWVGRLLDWAARTRPVAGELLAALAGEAFTSIAGGVGILGPYDVDAYGLAGPISRASGCHRTPTDSDGPVLHAGDAQARFVMLALEIEESIARLDGLGAEPVETGGPIDTKLSKIIKLPDGEVFIDQAAPMGTAGVHLTSRGGTSPWRLRLRTPSFANVQALHAALPGTPLHLADVVVASLGYTIGDLDK